MLLCPSYALGEFQVIAALWVKQVEVAACGANGAFSTQFPQKFRITALGPTHTLLPSKCMGMNGLSNFPK